jgi:hypothetical protein
MFWKFIRWGGTALIILLALAAVFIGKPSRPAEGVTSVPAEPTEAPPAKNFNL